MPHEKTKKDGLVLHEEELAVTKDVHEIGRVRVRKVVETARAEDAVALRRQTADVERVPPHDDETGEVETLPDGSISIPVLGEELVLSKRVVVLERLVVRRETVEEIHPVEAELRKERAEVDLVDDR